MEDNFYMVYVDGESTPTYKHQSKDAADTEAKRLVGLLDKKAYVLEAKYVVSPEDVSTKLSSFEKCCTFLGIAPKLPDVSMIPALHARAIQSIYKLFIINQAWNKADEFVPNFDDTNQYKWFPWFKKQGNAGFVCSSTNCAATAAAASVGSRLCFKESKRAKQFGEQFIDLWNDFLLLNH